MADTSPIPGAIKRSEVMRQAEAQPKKQVSPTFQAFVLAFVGLMLLGISVMVMLDGVLGRFW